ncbi:MAG: AAA family ATPase [Candidatus Nealsonbacteria bacterium]|nr:AAA family ATPase [Candidatus Nealsonbacteria bacterium]
MSGMTHLKVENYRSLADVSLELGPLNVMFGPNGSGKSTLLDTIWFFRDCATRGVELASSERSHGIGILWDGAEEGAQISLSLADDRVEYALSFGLSAGRIEPFAGERLRSKSHDNVLIERSVGSSKAVQFNAAMGQFATFDLREPDKLSLSRYLDYDAKNSEAASLDHLLHFVRFYDTRSFFLYRLKRQGSETSHEIRLWERGNNAWSVLRNLQDKRNVDARFNTIMQFMRESFPTFNELVLEQTGPNSVYASILEKGHRKEIHASGVSNGHLQMLLLLTALFSEGNRNAVILFDEPETSLHPWALAVLAKAIKLAAREWNKQVFLATHSPVLVGQFDAEDILAMEIEEGRSRPRRLSRIAEIADLLKEYDAGALYMAEMVAAQSKSSYEQGTD